MVKWIRDRVQLRKLHRISLRLAVSLLSYHLSCVIFDIRKKIHCGLFITGQWKKAKYFQFCLADKSTTWLQMFSSKHCAVMILENENISIPRFWKTYGKCFALFIKMPSKVRDTVTEPSPLNLLRRNSLKLTDIPGLWSSHSLYFMVYKAIRQ